MSEAPLLADESQCDQCGDWIYISSDEPFSIDMRAKFFKAAKPGYGWAAAIGARVPYDLIRCGVRITVNGQVVHDCGSGFFL